MSKMNKTQVLYIRLEPKDLELLKKAAVKVGLNNSKFVRMAIRRQVNDILGGVNCGEKTEKQGNNET